MKKKNEIIETFNDLPDGNGKWYIKLGVIAIAGLLIYVFLQTLKLILKLFLS